jgi:hypothetical protein
MSGSKETLCFTCGLPISDPPRFNHLPNGRPCPSCRDRLLESLPAPLPGVEARAPKKAAPARGKQAAPARGRSRLRPTRAQGEAEA